MNPQQRLLTLIWNNDPTSSTKAIKESGFDTRGINIYRRNLFANAQRALSITFPTIYQLLDSDVNEELVSGFLTSCPPDQGDWTQWGETFPHFIAVNQIAHEYAYLPDCAALDWHIHCALHGKDQVLDHASLVLLGSAEPENINIIFNENVALIKTNFPIRCIFDAHHHPEEQQRKLAMAQAKMALKTKPKEQVVMISRPEFQPKVTTLTDSDAEFMFCLKAGKSLAESLDTVSHYEDFSFEKWLVAAIEQNLILHFKENSL
jgi:hypothetical protein